MDTTLKTKLLFSLYRAYDSYVDFSSFACREGCCSCCTQSVNCTELEGKIISDYIQNQDMDSLSSLAEQLAGASPSTPSCTTNQFAGACLQGYELDTGEDEWSFTPCMFLSEGSCSIYPVRPFSCRSFASTDRCDHAGTANLPTEFISLNSAVMQIVEHIDQGHIWGNMIDVLAILLNRKNSVDEGLDLNGSPRVLLSQPSPGFLIPPEDEKRVLAFINMLFDTKIEGRTCGEWLCGSSQEKY